MAISKDNYTIGWISALDVELTSAIAMLDERLPDLPQLPGDHNTYTLGRVGNHRITIAGLPTGSIGNNPALDVVTHLVRSFPNVKCILLVGIGGGVPNISTDPMRDLRLGDIVVSVPEGKQSKC